MYIFEMLYYWIYFIIEKLEEQPKVPSYTPLERFGEDFYQFQLKKWHNMFSVNLSSPLEVVLFLI